MLNQCNFIGRLGRDPEIRYTQNGKTVVTFSIACSEKRNGQEFTEWVNIVTWDKLAEICHQYLTKGQLVYIGGRMRYNGGMHPAGGRCRPRAKEEVPWKKYLPACRPPRPTRRSCGRRRTWPATTRS